VILYPYAGWATSHLTIHSENGAEWKVTCPSPAHPDNDPSAYFNVEKGTWHCFACGFSGGVGYSNTQDADLQIGVLEFEIQRMIAEFDTEPESERILPEAALARYEFPTPYWSEKRHLSPEIITKFGLGYDAFADAATIPERTPDGDLLGVTRRFLNPDNPQDRYRYPKGFKKSQNLFGSWIDTNFSEVAITEGAIDAMKVWQVGMPCLGIYGAITSTYHIRIMRELGVKKVIWIGDGDRAGAEGRMRSRGLVKQANEHYKYKAELDMSKHFMLYYATDHQGKKDTGAMTDEEVLATLDSQEFFMPDQTLNYVKRRSRR
jgi:DNA primase